MPYVRKTPPKEPSTKPRLTADVAKTMPQKYCKTHGKRYIIHKDFSLCCHQDCFPASVNKFMSKNKIYLHLKQMDLLDDLYSWLQMKLLEELHEKNKPPVLNFPWLFMKIRNFYTGIIQKGLAPYNDLPSRSRDSRKHCPINEEIVAEIDDLNNSIINGFMRKMGIRREADTPEQLLMDHGLHQEVIRLTDNVMLAYLNDAITMQDVARIKKWSLSETRKWVKENKKMLQEELEKFRYGAEEV